MKESRLGLVLREDLDFDGVAQEKEGEKVPVSIFQRLRGDQYITCKSE